MQKKSVYYFEANKSKRDMLAEEKAEKLRLDQAMEKLAIATELEKNQRKMQKVYSLSHSLFNVCVMDGVTVDCLSPRDEKTSVKLRRILKQVRKRYSRLPHEEEAEEE